MIFNREKIIQENKDLDELSLKMLNDLDDVSLCKYLVWNHASSIMFNFVQYLYINIYGFILTLQVLTLITSLYGKATGTISTSASTLFMCIIILCSILILFISIVMNRARSKYLEDLRKINDYLELYHKVILDKEVK